MEIDLAEPHEVTLGGDNEITGIALQAGGILGNQDLHVWVSTVTQEVEVRYWPRVACGRLVYR